MIAMPEYFVTTSSGRSIREFFVIACSWKRELEPLDVCAQRLKACLSGLAACDPCFSQWYRLEPSRKKTLENQVYPDDSSALFQLIEKEQARAERRMRRDEAGLDHYFAEQKAKGKTLPTESNRFRHTTAACDLSLVTRYEDTDETIALTYNCGGNETANGATKRGNGLGVTLPKSSSLNERLATAPMLQRIVALLAQALTPDQVTVRSAGHAYYYRTNGERGRGAHVGWMAYLNIPPAQLPPLPAPAYALPFAPQGTLIMVTDDRFTAANPTHIRTANLVTERLKDAGLLQ
jgi:hypothetical protein